MIPIALRSLLHDIDWRWVGVALLVTLATYVARERRWVILLRPLAFRPHGCARALLTGQLLNLLLPIRMGDVVRSILLGREPAGSFARVFGSVLIEKAWDWLALCVLMLIVTWAAPLPDWFLAPARSIGLLAALVLLGFVGSGHCPGTLDSHAGWPGSIGRWPDCRRTGARSC